MAPITCAPNQVRLVFKNPIQCSTIAANGSDFTINGTYPVHVLSAAGDCNNNVSKEIIVALDKPLQQAGNFRLVLQTGSDGNTIVDECGEETLAGSSLSFSVKDTVNADFTYSIKYGCARDTIALFNNGAGVTSWNWDLDDRQHNTAQNPQGIYTIFTQKNIGLIVSNGLCSDTTSQPVLLDNYLKADFTVFADICPKEPVLFTGMAQGKIISNFWEFGDGATATTQTPSYTFLTPDQQRTINVRYTVTDSFGCQNTAVKPITVYTSCYLAVPTAFTPNNDGLNDFLAPLNAVKAVNLEFLIYNRWGQLIYSTKDWKHGWDGTFKGLPQPTATYVWMLQYTNRDTGKRQQLKGTAVLIR
jgi:gliding motility-associated-like protein